MIHRIRTLIAGFCAVVLWTVTASADVIHLKKGGRLEGILVSETSTGLTMDVGMGRVSVPRSSVARIERKGSALAEYRNRLAALAPDDVRAQADLARFAADHGLRSESRLMWVRVVSLDPRHVEGHLALGHVLVNGQYVDEDEAQRSQGLVRFEGRWITPAEQNWLLRERDRRTTDDRRVEEARRSAREAEDRARRAEREAERARADRAAETPAWGYGAPILVGSPHWGGYTAGCYGRACTTVPPMWPQPPTPAPTPVPIRNPPPPPRSIH